MNAESELFRAYREWHRLAQAETKAIKTRNWNLLNDCHQAIRDFQTMVGGLTLEARGEWRRAGCDLAEKERNVHVLVAQLIDLTRDNQSLLQSTMETARHRLDGLGEAGKNLKQLQRTYGSAPVRSRAA